MPLAPGGPSTISFLFIDEGRSKRHADGKADIEQKGGDSWHAVKVHGQVELVTILLTGESNTIASSTFKAHLRCRFMLPVCCISTGQVLLC